MCIWVSTFSTTGKNKREPSESAKHNFYKRWLHELRHRDPPVKIAPDPIPFNPALFWSHTLRSAERFRRHCENVAVQTIICSIGKTQFSAYEISSRPNATILPETPELFQKDICAYSRLIQTAYESWLLHLFNTSNASSEKSRKSNAIIKQKDGKTRQSIHWRIAS